MAQVWQTAAVAALAAGVVLLPAPAVAVDVQVTETLLDGAAGSDFDVVIAGDNIDRNGNLDIYRVIEPGTTTLCQAIREVVR